MNNIKSYHLVKEKGIYVLVIHLYEMDTEFANELGVIDADKKMKFYEVIKAHVEEKFPKINIPICKVMLGALLIATIPVAVSTAAHGGTATASTQTSMDEYTVVQGDTLYKISQKFGSSVGDIKTANSLIGDTIYTNQVLSIPLNKEDGLYRVQAGDTLWKISRKFSVSIDELKNRNALQSDTIYIGQDLKVSPEPFNTTATISYKDYQVVSGDNLWKIAVTNGIPHSELMLVNNMNDSTALKIGQIIRVPVHKIPIKPTINARYGENLDWWTEAQYVLPINKVAKITDFETGKTFAVKRTIGTNHSDTEPITYTDTEIGKSISGGYTWDTRPVIVEVDGRKLAASMSYMPHGTADIPNNGFDGHFDLHFLNSTRHVDGQIDPYHQAAIKIASGVTPS